MDISVQMKVNEKGITGSETEVAGGWVTIAGCLKFPVKVRKYMDNSEGKEKMFVSYPQKKYGDEYEGVVYPHDKNVREEIEKCVLESVKAEVMKDITLPAVDSVRVNMIKEEKSSPVILRGMASIKIAGMTINGIMIKESEKGLFVQMPQYRNGNTYRDTVYGTNTKIQQMIKNEVLQEYGRQLEEIQLPDKTEQSSAEKFFRAFEKGNEQEMLEVLSESDLQMEQPVFTENGNAVKNQLAVLEKENKLIHIAFINSYNPLQETPPEDFLKQQIEARIFENGVCIGAPVLFEKKSRSLKNAAKNYKELLDIWKVLTKQEQITFENRAVQKEKQIPAPKM